LDAYLFEDIDQVQVLADEWMEDYNYNRPHEALGGITPDLYKRLNHGAIENFVEFPTSPQLQQQ
jgi:putative transposase